MIYVYFIQAGDASGPIKIGVTNDPASRLSSLQTSCAEPLTLLRACPGSYEIEADLHVHFAAERLRGEWFLPTIDLMAIANGDAPIERVRSIRKEQVPSVLQPRRRERRVSPLTAMRTLHPGRWEETVRATMAEHGGRVQEAANALRISTRQLFRVLKDDVFKDLARAPIGVHRGDGGER